MCGIAGWWDLKKQSTEKYLQYATKRMTDTIVARGPDREGFWVSPKDGIAFGHRRLSIIDTSAAGDQPMQGRSRDGWIILNGEIYNHQLLRKQLTASGTQFRGHSDTEILLASIEEWGLEVTLKKIVGMFAFAYWDSRQKTLAIVRDRAGEKPLYWGLQNHKLYFASELRAIKQHPDFCSKLDQEAAVSFLRFGYVPSGQSIFKNIKKLPPATMLTFKQAGNQLSLTGPIAYWSLDKILHKPVLKRTDEEAINETESLLEQSVKQQMIADVPLGAFLSGGIDSSLIVALMQKQSVNPIKTFSIGFYDKHFNEAGLAKCVAQYLKTDHTEYYVTEKDARNLIPDIPKLYDEPFADSSQIPMLLLSKMARQDVTVALSGDAGDELFGGYNRYAWTKQVFQKTKLLPKSLNRLVACGLQRISSKFLDTILSNGVMQKIIPSKFNVSKPGEKVQKLASLLQANSKEEIYELLISIWQKSDRVISDMPWPNSNFINFEKQPFETAMMYHDFCNYLPDDILVKVDRATMSSSLESRIPFLDHRLIEHAFRLSLDKKIRNNNGKWILRKILHRYVPSSLVDRPKMGFGIPVGSWLKTELRPWAESLLASNKLNRIHFINKDVVRAAWEDHLVGRRNRTAQIWSVLMLQAWYDQYL